MVKLLTSRNYVYIVLFVSILPKLVEFALRKSFKVHQRGGVVITGASSGIGQHATQALVTSGYTVFAGVRKQADADRLAVKINGVIPVIIDVTKQESIDEAKNKITDKLKKLDLPLIAVVNNAGVQKDLPVEFQDPAADRFTFDVNVFGLLNTVRAFIPMLRETGKGARIINIGSLAGIIASPGSATYVGSKFAVEGITDSLRMELAPFGISVSLLQPGYVYTQMGAKLHDGTPNYGLTPEQYDLYRHVFEGFFETDKDNASQELASSPQVTTDAILDAITNPFPKTRYVVANVGGIPAVVVSYIKNLIPDLLMDLLQ